MDGLSILNSMMPTVAYNASREQEIANQQRVAQAQQMLQEARLKAEMQPYDIQNKQAQAEYYKALALKQGQDRSQADSEKVAKAEALKRMLAGRDTRGALETALAFPQDVSSGGPSMGAYLDRLIEEKRIRPDVVNRLRPDDKTNLYTNDNIRAIIESLSAEDPELAKTARIQYQQDSATGRNDANIASRERVAQWSAEARKAIAAAKTANQKESLEQQAARYKALANDAKDPEEKAAYLQMYIESKEAAESVRAAAAVAGPPAQTEAKLKQLEGVMSSGRGSQGRIGGGPVSGNNIEAGAIKAWGSYDPSKYDYRVGPNGNLQRKPKGQ